MVNHLKIIYGDLIELAETGVFDVIIHGCNCFNTMGAGIARQIADKWPRAEWADSTTAKGDRDKLGNWSEVYITPQSMAIVNAYTQYTTSGHKDVFEYDKFELFLKRYARKVSSDYLKFNKIITIGFPEIGMGLAGGDKNRIYGLLDNFAWSLNKYAKVIVVKYKLKDQK